MPPSTPSPLPSTPPASGEPERDGESTTAPPSAEPERDGDSTTAPTAPPERDGESTTAPTAEPAGAVAAEEAETAGPAAVGAAPDQVSQAPVSVPPQAPIGRIPVVDVTPLVDGGVRPTKSVVDEEFLVTATVLREGHDAVNATVVLTDPDGVDHLVPMVCTNPGLHHWEAVVSADQTGWWTFRVEGWSDPFGTWEHDATIKIQADVDTDLMLDEGALLLERAAASDERSAEGRAAIEAGIEALRDTTRPPQVRLSAVTHGPVHDELTTTPVRDLVSPSTAYPLLVERELALSGAWYEFFPRSEGATYDDDTHTWTSGTLRTAAKRLTAVAGMGFDVIYLTPIHPIGSAAKKGPNNTLDAGPDDPGSPYAIGSADGGHDAIHPDLGTFADLDAFVAEARRLGLEVAMDLALQCSPDHPWVIEHPEWFTTRADGTIAYAENPPKKYQDIYPLNFDNDPAGAYAEVRRVVQVWIDHGVTLFRVDNPHTKPVEFWQWLIQDVARDHSDIIWLSEAFTKPAMMRTLAKVGFQQSYTYYAWRNSKHELQEYVAELATETAPYMRPSFWPTTHDILTPYMQFGGPAAWKLRAALAATLVPTYGIYAGYELMEHVARPGAEEQIDNEKYEYKNRHWEDFEPGGAREGQSLAWYLRRLNEIRRQHPALQWLRNITFHHVDDENIMAFSKRRVVPADEASGTPEHEDVVIVIANLDPHSTRWSRVVFDMPALGLHPDEGFRAHDLITDQWWDFMRESQVHLGPEHEPVHIIELKRW